MNDKMKLEVEALIQAQLAPLVNKVNSIDKQLAKLGDNVLVLRGDLEQVQKMANDMERAFNVVGQPGR